MDRTQQPEPTIRRNRPSPARQPVTETEAIFPPGLPEDARHGVSILMDIIEEAAPLPPTHRKSIRFDVLDLWKELTSERSARQADYIGEPAKFAAYLRYFLPWNVVRLIPILAGLELPEHEELRILDIGSGPLTLPIALWLARPDLRKRKVSIHCCDRVRRILETGLSIFDGLRLRTGSQDELWKLHLSKAVFPFIGDQDQGRHHLVCSANVFNESFWQEKNPMGERAETLLNQLTTLVATDGRVLLVEPGDPRSGSMLSAVREATILSGGRVLAPCTHQRACPMPGIFTSEAFRDHEGARPPITPVVLPKGRQKMPWCHFVLDSGAAPEKLLKFSETAGLPKDRLVASWLYVEPACEEPEDEQSEEPTTAVAPRPHGSASWAKRSLRIISDSFALREGGRARYACGCTGYLLVTGELAEQPSGTRIILKEPLPDRHSRKDPKSGAIVIGVHSAHRQSDPRLSESARTDRERPRRTEPGRDVTTRRHSDRTVKDSARAPRSRYEGAPEQGAARRIKERERTRNGPDSQIRGPNPKAGTVPESSKGSNKKKNK